jgi:hypothetical protein
MDNERLYSPKAIEDQPLNRIVMAHGAMHYQCKECGRMFRMWLEKGVEDCLTPDIERKPAPFTMGCLCGGEAHHIAWTSDIQFDSYRPITETMDYFENIDGCDHGIPHLRTNGNANLLLIDGNQLANLMQQQEEEKKAERELLHTRDGLEHYSTTQLKEELRRRKRQ